MSIPLLSTSYDNEADALYITIRKGSVARTVELDDWTLVDVDANGAALGIEVIHPAREWPLTEFLDQFKIDTPHRWLLEDMFPAKTRSRRAAFTGQGTDVDSAAEPVSLAM